MVSFDANYSDRHTSRYNPIKRSKENTGRRIQGPALLQLNYKNHWTYRQQHAQMTAKFITSLHSPPRTRHARMCDKCSYKNASSFELEGMDVVLTQSPVPSISAASTIISRERWSASRNMTHHTWARTCRTHGNEYPNYYLLLPVH